MNTSADSNLTARRTFSTSQTTSNMMNDDATQTGTDGWSTIIQRSSSQRPPGTQRPSSQDGRGEKPQRTQEDQDKDDDKARKKAMENLVQSWMDRLQLISVITTFFAATESQLLSITTPASGGSNTPTENATNAAFTGAMVFHVFAAVLSFLASFVLVRFKFKEAKQEERKAEDAQAGSGNSSNGKPFDHNQTGDIEKTARQSQTRSSMTNYSSVNRRLYSSNPHIAQVGPWRMDQPPVWLLERCHVLCLWTATFGFILAFAGIVAFAWANQTQSTGIFSSVCMAGCLIALVGIFVVNPGDM